MDITEDDLNRHINALQANTEALLGRSSSRTRSSISKQPDYESASKGLSRYSSGLSSLSYQVNKVTGHLGSLGGGTEKLLSSFDTLLRGIVGGAIISTIVKEGHDLAKRYHDLADIGQTFGGSLIELGKQAGEAGLPLGEFARLLEKNSSASAILQQQSATTGGNLVGLAGAVRNSTREFGFYGMSVNQVNDLTSDYTETLRLQGRLSGSNMQTNAMSIASFAKDIADFSSVTGKSRKQIIETTMSAMRDVGFAATNLSTVQQKAATSAIAFTASMPGSAGDALSKMLSQSIAYGSSIFADGMQDFAQSGGAEFLGIIDNIAGKVKNGAFSDKDAQTALQDMQNFYKNNKDMLVVQAQAGNQQAKNVLAMMQQLNGLDAKQYAEKMRQQKRLGSITQFFATLDDQLSKLSGVFMASMFKVLEPLEKSFGKGEGIFNAFQSQFASAGTSFGNMIASLADPKNVAMIPVIISDILAVGNGFISVISGLASVAGFLLTGFSKIHDFLGKFDKTLADWGVGIVAVGLLFSKTILSVVSGIRALFKAQVVTVNGGVVNVNGKPTIGNGPSGLDGLGPHDPKDPLNPKNKPAPAPAQKAGLRGKLAGAKTGIGNFLRGNKVGIAGLAAGLIAEGVSNAGAPNSLGPHDPNDPHNPKNKPEPAQKVGLRGKLAGAKTGIGNFLQGNKLGIAGMAAGLIAEAYSNYTPEGTPGKETLGAAAEYSGTGSIIGGVLGGIVGILGGPGGIVAGAIAGSTYGAGAGAVIGAISANFDDIKTILTPADHKADKWMYDHLYGASWLDNLTSHIGVGLSYAQQKEINNPANPANPANPNENNPYMDMSQTNVNERMNEVADTINALKEVSSNDELVTAMQNGNAINKRIAELLEEQKALQAVAAAKNYQQQRNIIRNQDIQIGTFGE